MRVADTDILIDILRGFVAAIEWFRTLPEPPAVVSLSVMELIQGCRSHRELQQVSLLIAPLPIWYPTAEETSLALELLYQYHLQYRIGIIDAIIAACVRTRGATLCTFNTRHYAAIPDLKLESPYSKSGSNG